MGAKRKGKVVTLWGSEFAYAIGLIATDGNLSPDGRHIHFTSKDEELIIHFKNALKLTNKIGKKARGGSIEKRYFVLQFGDRNFYDFLLSIGLMPAKSKILKEVKVPDDYFRDFLRGCLDGDGSIGAFRHPESQHLQLRVRFYSASPEFLVWLKRKIHQYLNIESGWIEKMGKQGVEVLAYGIADSLKILRFMYYDSRCLRLGRKYEVAKPFIGQVAELV